MRQQDRVRTGGRAARVAFGIAIAFFLLEYVVRIEPSLATAQIAAFFGLSRRGFGTLSSIFFWVYTPMQLLVGLLLDRYGARRFVILGCFCCGAGAAVFAWIPNLEIAMMGRALAGLGASFAFVSALWLVSHGFAPQRFALLSGAVNGIGMLGTAISAVVLANAASHMGWRLVSVCTGLAGLVLGLVAFIFLRDPPSAATSPRGDRPSMRRNLQVVCRDPQIWLISVVGMFYYVPVSIYGGLWGTTALVHDRAFSELSAATAVSMVFWGLAVGSVSGGWLSDKLGDRKYLLIAGATLTAISYASAIFLPGSAYSIGLFLFAAGLFGGLQMLTFALAKERLPAELAGTTLAFVNMIGIAGALVLQPLVGEIADVTGGDYCLALAVVPVCAALSAILALWIMEVRHPDHQTRPSH